MKLSISWIFNHINADFKKINLADLVSKFNKTTAEIESVKKVETDLNNLFVAKVISPEVENVILSIPEINKEIELPKRTSIKKDQLYLVKKENDTEFSWATSLDLGSEKEMIIPELFLQENMVASKWKDQFEKEDYILEVDNKSVTHRPDMWGHRGFAREIAAILGLELLPLEDFLAKQEITEKGSSNEINPSFCKRFATLTIKDVKNKPSTICVITRLSRIDSRAINSIVDATNYVMFDLGQPMHAFDAGKINGSIKPRFAQKSEKLTLLDGSNIELSEQDLVISDDQVPVALAGIMGGQNSQVDENTKTLLIESACFDSGVVRRSAIRHKKRTEASSRFEKSLDPNQNCFAILRFLKVLNEENISYVCDSKIISLGDKSPEVIIDVEHDFIQKRLGVKIEPSFVMNILKKLDFKVEGQYKIVVPSFRSTKDVIIAEDIVEEVGRFFGYDNIPYLLPSKQMSPNDQEFVYRLRLIKDTMSYTCQMNEVQNYPFFDEAFLQELNWQPGDTPYVLSPISENWKRLVSSLVPNLIKNVQTNLLKNEDLNFYEFNRIWEFENGNAKEKQSLSGIFYNHKQNLDFYDYKAKLTLLFDALNLNIKWVKSLTIANNPWYSKYQTADIYVNDKKIGTAGNVSPEFITKIFPISNAFVFELDGDFLLTNIPKTQKFIPISKYPVVWLDISIFIELNKTVDQITNLIEKSDAKIIDVQLVDSFVKEDWINKKSLTFRYSFVDQHKTMTKQEIDEVANSVNTKLLEIGAQLR